MARLRQESKVNEEEEEALALVEAEAARLNALAEARKAAEMRMVMVGSVCLHRYYFRGGSNLIVFLSQSL